MRLSCPLVLLEALRGRESPRDSGVTVVVAAAIAALASIAILFVREACNGDGCARDGGEGRGAGGAVAAAVVVTVCSGATTAAAATATARVSKRACAGGPWRSVRQNGVRRSRRIVAFIHTEGLVHVYHRTTYTDSMCRALEIKWPGS